MEIMELLGNRELVRLIDFFISNYGKEFSQIEIIKSTKISKATAIKWLSFLVKRELIFMRKIGVSNLYKLNFDNPITNEVKRLKVIMQIEELKKLPVEEVYVYGSSARGDYNIESDVDLLIIGRINRKDIIEDIDKLSKRIGKNISFQIFSELEWSQMSRKDKPFYERVEKDKVKIK